MAVNVGNYIDKENKELLLELKVGFPANINGSIQLVRSAYNPSGAKYHSRDIITIKESREYKGLVLEFFYDPVNGKDPTQPINILAYFGTFAEEKLKKLKDARL